MQSRKLYLLFLFCLSVFLVSSSCTDHDAPTVPPELKTLEVTAPPVQQRCGIYFKLEVVSLGDAPVKEYGIVFYALGTDSGPVTNTPILNINAKEVFDQPFGLGEKTKVAKPFCTSDLYYRAYAVLDDDTIIYGNTLAYLNH